VKKKMKKGEQGEKREKTRKSRNVQESRSWQGGPRVARGVHNLLLDDLDSFQSSYGIDIP
jgi:hypothetical protein